VIVKHQRHGTCVGDFEQKEGSPSYFTNSRGVEMSTIVPL
jgi:hypothetical protein